MSKVFGVFNHTLFGFLLLFTGGLITSNGPTNLGNNLACVYFNLKFLVESSTRSPSTSEGDSRRCEERAHSVRNLLDSKQSRALVKIAKQRSVIFAAAGKSSVSFSKVPGPRGSYRCTRWKGDMLILMCFTVFIANSARVKFSAQSETTAFHKVHKVLPRTRFTCSILPLLFGM